MLGAARSGALPRKDVDVPGRLQQGDLHILDPQATLLAQRSIEIGPADQFAAKNTLKSRPSRAITVGSPSIIRSMRRFRVVSQPTP